MHGTPARWRRRRRRPRRGIPAPTGAWQVGSCPRPSVARVGGQRAAPRLSCVRVRERRPISAARRVRRHAVGARAPGGAASGPTGPQVERVQAGSDGSAAAADDADRRSTTAPTAVAAATAVPAAGAVGARAGIVLAAATGAERPSGPARAAGPAEAAVPAVARVDRRHRHGGGAAGHPDAERSAGAGAARTRRATAAATAAATPGTAPAVADVAPAAASTATAAAAATGARPAAATARHDVGAAARAEGGAAERVAARVPGAPGRARCTVAACPTARAAGAAGHRPGGPGSLAPLASRVARGGVLPRQAARAARAARRSVAGAGRSATAATRAAAGRTEDRRVLAAVPAASGTKARETVRAVAAVRAVTGGPGGHRAVLDQNRCGGDQSDAVGAGAEGRRARGADRELLDDHVGHEVAEHGRRATEDARGGAVAEPAVPRVEAAQKVDAAREVDRLGIDAGVDEHVGDAVGDGLTDAGADRVEGIGDGAAAAGRPDVGRDEYAVEAERCIDVGEEVVGEEVDRRLDAVLLGGEVSAAAVERDERGGIAAGDLKTRAGQRARDLELRVSDAAVRPGRVQVLGKLALLLLFHLDVGVLPECLADVPLAAPLVGRARDGRRPVRLLDGDAALRFGPAGEAVGHPGVARGGDAAARDGADEIAVRLRRRGERAARGGQAVELVAHALHREGSREGRVAQVIAIDAGDRAGHQRREALRLLAQHHVGEETDALPEVLAAVRVSARDLGVRGVDPRCCENSSQRERQDDSACPHGPPEGARVTGRYLVSKLSLVPVADGLSAQALYHARLARVNVFFRFGWLSRSNHLFAVCRLLARRRRRDRTPPSPPRAIRARRSLIWKLRFASLAGQ